MTQPKIINFETLISELKTKYQKEFSRTIRDIWYDKNDTEIADNRERQEKSARAMEMNVRDLVLQVAAQMRQVLKSPHTLGKFEGVISEYLSDLRSDLLRISSLATKLRATEIFDEVIFQEIRRRTERHIDSCRDAFVFVDNLGEANTKKKPGAKPTYDWLKATNAVWGRIYRRELKATKQVHIERALEDFIGNEDMGETTARPFAQPIWREMGNQPED